MDVLSLAISHKKALVCGTTGFTEDEMQRFMDASKVIPMLYAANTSKLVNIMNKLLELVATTLKDEIDIEILEMHDQWKKDAPSGTSREMGEIMAHALATIHHLLSRHTDLQSKSVQILLTDQFAVRLFHEFLVCALLHDPAPVKDNNLIAEPAQTI